MSGDTTGPLLRIASVIAKTGLSRVTIYRRIKDGSFPQPLKLGARAVAWKSGDIDVWVQSLARRGVN